jgi:hypothetical protein
MYGFDGYGGGVCRHQECKVIDYETFVALLQGWNVIYRLIGFFLKDPPNLGKPSLLQFLPNLESIYKNIY